MINKISTNFLFYSSLLFFVVVCLFLASNKKITIAFSTNQVGGRLGTVVQAGTCGCVHQPPCPHGCLCGNHDATIIPSGVSAAAMCPPPAMPVRTGIPPNPGSVGVFVLGYCETLIPTAACSNFGTSYK